MNYFPIRRYVSHVTAIRSDDSAALAIARQNGWQLLDKRRNGVIRFVGGSDVGKSNTNAAEGDSDAGKSNEDAAGGGEDTSCNGPHVR